MRPRSGRSGKRTLGVEGRVGVRRARLSAPVASIAVFLGIGAGAFGTGRPAALGAEEAVGADGAASAQAGVRRRYTPRVRLSVTLANRGTTRIAKLGVEDAPGDAVVRLTCSGSGCPSEEQLALNPLQPQAFGNVMIGRRLGAGAKLEVRTSLTRDLGPFSGPSVPVPFDYTTRFVMRRGAIPRRADSCTNALMLDCHDPSIVGSFRVQGRVTRVTRLRVAPISYDDVFRFDCRGRSCPLGDVKWDERASGVDFAEWFFGARLAPGTRITVGYVTQAGTIVVPPGVDRIVPLTSCAATEWTTRRGRAPRRIDIGAYEGEDPYAVHRACSAPFR